MELPLYVTHSCNFMDPHNNPVYVFEGRMSMVCVCMCDMCVLLSPLYGERASSFWEYEG